MAAAERELGVSFPAEYRAYLLEAGAGGTVSRLARTEQDWWWENNSRAAHELLAVPFPHPDSYVGEDDRLSDREPCAEDFSDAGAYQAAWQAWDDEYGVSSRSTAAASPRSSVDHLPPGWG